MDLKQCPVNVKQSSVYQYMERKRTYGQFHGKVDINYEQINKPKIFPKTYLKA